MSKPFSQPDNYNPLSEVNFKFMLKRAPAMTYTGQKVALPSLTLPMVNQPTQFVDIPRHGDKISFEPLTLDFLIDEDLQNYKEIFNWMVELGFPENHGQHARALSKAKGSGEGLYSDATLSILNSAKNVNHNVIFHDVWPTSLSSLNFDLTTSESNYLFCTATFAYSLFTFA